MFFGISLITDGICDFVAAITSKKINKAQKNTEIGTKSQQALKLQQEQIKDNKKAIKKIKREEEAKRQFEFKQKKKKHRGH